jgi:hypothetical protein
MCADKRPLSKGFIEYIHRAFSTSNPPLEHEIAETLYPSEKWIVQALAGKRWDEVESQYISALGCELSLLTFKALSYFLPALLRHAYHNQDEQFSWFVLCAVGPDSAHGMRLLKNLSPEQLQVVLRFINWSEKMRFCRKEALRCATFWGDT